MKQIIEKEVTSTSLRLQGAALFVAVGLAWTYIANHLLPGITAQYGAWVVHPQFYYINPIGIDFRVGIYQPAQLLAQGESPFSMSGNWYPPFVSLLGLPYTLFSENVAYRIHVVLLALANVACLALALRIASRVFLKSAGEATRSLSFTLFAAISFYLVSSYGFLFSFERGNYDIVAMFFALLTLWLIIARPDSIWFSVLAISIAGHLKIYPLALLPLVVLQHRKKSILPLLIVNIVLLFCLGPENVLKFFNNLFTMSKKPLLWIGNHSALSFTETVLASRGWGTPFIARAAFVLPVVLWLTGGLLLLKRGVAEVKMVFLFLLSIPLMHLLPVTSHDYKLVILTGPLAILLCYLIQQFVEKGKWVDAVLVGAIVGCMGFLARSYAVTGNLWLQNKYVWIVMVQLIIVAAIFRMPSVTRAGLTSFQCP